jgi:hypothetical protein
MNQCDNAVFVYRKDNEVRVLKMNSAMMMDKTLKEAGWEHTATIDSVGFIRWLLSAHPDEVADEIREIGAPSIEMPTD